MIYPEDKFKQNWDILITLAIIISCVYVPYNLAFQNSDDITSLVFEEVSCVLFGIDMIFCFFTASYDIDYKIVEDRKEISFNYLKGWFFIDLIATLPISTIINMI